MDWTLVFNFLNNLAPWANYVLMGLGTLSVIGTAIDALVPDTKDGGFMKKILAIPVLGGFLQAVQKFSPLNYRDPNQK